MGTNSSSAAVVLLSGGQDSTTCLFWAKKRFEHVHAVAFDYGQRHRSELEAASAISKLAGLEHELVVLELGVLAQLGDSSLVRSSGELASSGGYGDDQASEGLPTSFVPGRNLLFLGVAAAYAVKNGIKDIVTGVCETDCSGYPDCREAFVEAMQGAVNEAMPSSAGPVRIHTPLMHMDKARTVWMARGLGDDCWRALAMSVTCYEGQRPGCGTCPSCRLRAAGFERAGLEDPALEGPPTASLSSPPRCPRCKSTNHVEKAAYTPCFFCRECGRSFD
jgi:7-cyano-7-deazaguanine synthase